MTLIKTVEKANGFIMRTYKSQRNGRITHILEPQGVVKGKRAIFCDKFENPQKVIIATKNKQKEIHSLLVFCLLFPHRQLSLFTQHLFFYIPLQFLSKQNKQNKSKKSLFFVEIVEQYKIKIKK